MCKNATATAAALLAGIEPTLTAFLKLENISADEQASVIAAYEAAQKAVATWTPGSTGTVAVEAVQALNSIFQTLPVPDVDKVFASLITAGLTSVIAIIEANSTTNVLEQHAITAKAVTDVNAMAPGAFKYHKGIFAVFQADPAKEYHNAWHKQVQNAIKLDPKYQALMVA
jgi:hypothetical protein